MTKIYFILLFFIFTSFLYAQTWEQLPYGPDATDATEKFIFRFNPHTGKPDYQIKDQYLIDSIVYANLRELTEGYGIVNFLYDGSLDATITVDTGILFPAIRNTINIKSDSLFFQFTNISSTSGWYNLGDTVYIDTSGTGGASFLEPYKTFINGSLNSFGHYRLGNQVIFLSPLKLYTEVVFIGEYSIEAFHKIFEATAGQTTFNLSEIDYHVFEAAAGQTVFDCSPYFVLNEKYKVFINGSYQSYGYSMSNSTVTFDTGLAKNTEVMIMSGHVYDDQYYHVFEAAAGQTNFSTTAYFQLNNNYKVWVNGSFQSSGHSRLGNTVIFDTGMKQYDEITISL